MSSGSSSGKPSQRTLLMRGVDCLSRREYGRLELGKKLQRTLHEGETQQDIEECLDTLEARGYLNNERYAQTRARQCASRYGNRRIAQELAVGGIDRECIAAVLSEVPDELIRARTIWQNKFGELPQDRHERDRQVRFLAARGFSFDTIASLLKGGGEDYAQTQDE